MLRCVLCILMPLALFGCFALPEEEPILAPPRLTSPQIAYRTHEVGREDIENKAYLYGHIRPSRKEELYFTQRSGRLSRLYVEQGDLAKKGAILAELNTASMLNEYEQQQIRLAKAELNLERVKALNASRYEVRLAQLDVDMARLQADELSSSIAGARLVAPFGGIVENIAVKEGANIQAYDPIILLTDPSDLILECEISKDAEYFYLGMEIETRVKNELYRGTIVEYPEGLEKARIEDEYIVIRIDRLPNTVYDPENPILGMIAHVLERSEDAIVVPVKAVHNYAGRQYVKVLEEGLVVEKYVETGISTSTKMEITEGIKEGEQVILD